GGSRRVEGANPINPLYGIPPWSRFAPARCIRAGVLPGLIGHIPEGDRPTALMRSVTVLRSGGPPPVSPFFTSAATALYLGLWSICVISQTLTVPSWLPETRSRPSGLNARLRTKPV